MARIMVTGAAGFIGSNLCKRLLSDGYDVAGVDDLSAGYFEFIGPVFSKYPASWCMLNDFSDEKVLTSIREKRYDVVVHLAAKPRVSYSVEHPVETHEINVTKTLRLIDACRGNIKRFIFASSSSVYGGAVGAYEAERLAPKSPYALQKMIIEQYLEQYDRHYGFESISLRFFNVFGPNSIAGGAYAMALTSWLTAIKNGQPIRSDDDGTQTRDMCYVDNTVHGVVQAIKHPENRGASVFNIACGECISNNEIIEYLQNRYPNVKRIDAPARPGDVRHTLADIRGARMFLNYDPQVKALDGIERTCQWFDDNWEFIQKLQVRKS